MLLWEIGEPLAPDKVLSSTSNRRSTNRAPVKTNASKELQAVRRAIAEKVGASSASGSRHSPGSVGPCSARKRSSPNA